MIDFLKRARGLFGRSPDEMAGDLRLAAAVHWYSRGLMSQERAAQVAGLDRPDFILALASQWATCASARAGSPDRRQPRARRRR